MTHARTNRKDIIFSDWLRERNAAVESLDLKKFRKFYDKWKKRGVYARDFPSDEVAEIAMYKCACNISLMPCEVVEQAKKWLDAHGYDGEIR